MSDKKIAFTNIPGRDRIELPAYYEEFAWYYPDCELQTKKWLVENAQKDWVYIDCGANIGYYSILFSQLSPKGTVHAVEPTETITKLITNLQYNHADNVTTHQQALGSSVGKKIEKIFRIWGQAPEEMEYDFNTVDALVEQLGLERLDCLKIDVDSFDFEVLMGAEQSLKRFNPWLIVELNHALGVRGYSNMAAVEWLKDRGYNEALVLDYDNFVLRRGTKPTGGDRNFQLTFPPKKSTTSAETLEQRISSIPVNALPSLFGDANGIGPKASSLPLDEWVLETGDAPILTYIYKQVQPKRHLEFGTWQGWGTSLCLESCDATVWTINLSEGETKPSGDWAYGERVTSNGPTASGVVAETYGSDEQGPITYHRTDAGSYIGHLYREKGLGHRVNQIYSDSRDWDNTNYPEDFFDSVLIDGGHASEVVISDTRKALQVLKPGGVIMWHDFCPVPQIREGFDSVKGVTAAIERILPELEDQLQTLVWIDPSWILLGIKK